MALPALEDPSARSRCGKVASACSKCGSRRPRASDSGQSGLGALCGNATLQRSKEEGKKTLERVNDQTIHRLATLPTSSMNRTIWPCHYCLDDTKMGNRVQHLLHVCEDIPEEHKLRLIACEPEKRQQLVTMLEFPQILA